MVTTEIAVFNLKEGLSSNIGSSETHLKSIQTVTSQPGCLKLLWGLAKEDANKLYWVIEWANYEAHATFMNSDAYKPFVAEVLSIADKNHPSGPVEMSHYDFQAPLSTVISPSRRTIEFFHMNLKPEIDDAQLAEALEAFAQACKSEGVDTLYSRRREDKDIVMSPVIWSSVEEHMAFREKPIFGEIIGKVRALFTGAGVKHVELVE